MKVMPRQSRNQFELTPGQRFVAGGDSDGNEQVSQIYLQPGGNAHDPRYVEYGRGEAVVDMIYRSGGDPSDFATRDRVIKKIDEEIPTAQAIEGTRRNVAQALRGTHIPGIS